MTTPDPVREAFEKWAKTAGFIHPHKPVPLLRTDRHDEARDLEIAWQGWQAALSTPPSQAPVYDTEAFWLLSHAVTRESVHEWTRRRDAWLKKTSGVASPPPNTPREE